MEITNLQKIFGNTSIKVKTQELSKQEQKQLEEYLTKAGFRAYSNQTMSYKTIIIIFQQKYYSGYNGTPKDAISLTQFWDKVNIKQETENLEKENIMHPYTVTIVSKKTDTEPAKILSSDLILAKDNSTVKMVICQKYPALDINEVSFSILSMNN